MLRCPASVAILTEDCPQCPASLVWPIEADPLDAGTPYRYLGTDGRDGGGEYWKSMQQHAVIKTGSDSGGNGAGVNRADGANGAAAARPSTAAWRQCSSLACGKRDAAGCGRRARTQQSEAKPKGSLHGGICCRRAARGVCPNTWHSSPCRAPRKCKCSLVCKPAQPGCRNVRNNSISRCYLHRCLLHPFSQAPNKQQK